MKRSLALVGLCLLATACGSSSSTAPTVATPTSAAIRTDSPSSFGTSIHTTFAAMGTSVDLARCLQGSGGIACFVAARMRTLATGESLMAAPSGLVASANGSSVTLTWNAPAGTAVAAYIIEAGSAVGLTDLANFSTGNALTSFSASGVGNGRYYVRLRAVAPSGEVSAPTSDALLVVGGSSPCTAPGSPSGLVVISAISGTVVLGWTAAPGNPTSYIVEAGSGSGLTNLANSDLGGIGLGLTANGVGAGTYYVRMRAKNTCGMSGPSNEVVFVMAGPPTPIPRTTFGAGKYLVNRDIAAGRYYTVPVYGCYWERLSGLGGTLGEIIANDFIGFTAAQAIVDILSSDLAFSTDSDCRTWFNTPRYGFQTSISQGTWLVSSQVAAGTYRANASYGCYWERLRNFTGSLNGIIANQFVSAPGPQLVTISATDAGFHTDDDCAVWTRVGALTEDSAGQSAADIEQNRQLHRAKNSGLTKRVLVR